MPFEDVGRMAEFLVKALPYTETRVGWLGLLDDNDKVLPDIRQGLEKPFVWVRLTPRGNEIRAIDSNTSLPAGRKVDLGKRKGSSYWHVIGVADDEAVNLGGAAGALNQPPSIDDLTTTSVGMRRLKWFKTSKGSGGSLYVYVGPGWYIDTDGSLTYWSGGEINLTSHQPSDANKKVPVLIGLTSGGSLTSTAGTEVSVFTSPTDGVYFNRSTFESLENSADASTTWLHGIAVLGQDSDFSGINYRTETLWPATFKKRALGLLKVSSNDTTPGLIGDKVTAGSVKITITEVNDGSDEDLEIDLGTVNVSDLSDVDVTGLGNGNVLVWNNSLSQWEPGTATGTDEKVGVSANDTTPDYLLNKLAAGSSQITITETNDGANEDITLDVIAVDPAGDTMTGQLLIDGGSDEIQLQVQANASQTADILSLEDSSGSHLFTVDASGDVLMTQHFALGNNASVNADRVWVLDETFDNPSSATFGGDITCGPNATSGALSSDSYGLRLRVQVPSTTTQNINAFLYGIWGSIQNQGSGDINHAIGMFPRIDNQSSGTINNAYGLRVGSNRNTGAGSITTNIGIQIDDQTVGTNNYGLYSGTGLFSLGDDLEFRNDTDGVILQDRTTGTSYRLYVDSGTLSIESV